MARKSNTRAAQGSGTIRKKTVERNGKKYVFWEARLTVGYDAGTGKQIQRSFHDLRHTYAVLSLRSGCDIKTVQENLGHYAAAFTLDTYAHVTEQMRREGADKMNRLLDALEAGLKHPEAL